MRYDSIAIDAETVAHNGFHFDSGLLAQLKQFADGPTDVVVSTVVESEILKHLIDLTQEAKNKIEIAHKKAVEFGLKGCDESVFGEQAPNVRDVAKSRLEKFFKEIRARIIPANDVPMQSVLQRYFNAEPPFATSGKKKNEFPDAITLLSLEAWADKNDKRILAVSNDKDWAAYAEKSERIGIVKDLSDALAKLQQHAEEANEVVRQMLEDLQMGNHDQLRSQFLDWLTDAVSEYGSPVYARADSALEVEGGAVQLTLLNYTILRNGEDYLFKVVRARAEEIVARVNLEIKARAEASFSLSVYDSIDQDYVELGFTDAATMVTFEAAVLVTFEGDFTSNEVEVSEVELLDGPRSIYFGHVGMNDDDDDSDEDR